VGPGGFVFFVDGQPYKNLGGTELQLEMGPFDPNDNHAYSIVQVNAAGKASDQSVAVKVVPALSGLSLDDARAALGAKGFTAGDITVVDSQLPSGTVVGAANLVGVTAPVGSAIPLQVSGGTGGGGENTKFVFNVVATKRLPLSIRRYIGVHIAVTRATTVSAVLRRSGKIVGRWHVTAAAGVSTVKLPLSKAARRPGRYLLSWTAVSGSEVAQRTLSLVMVPTTKHAPKPATVDVVLAGSDLPKQLPTVTKREPRVVATSGESTFALTGDPARNVEVVVIDADQYGIDLIRNLRTVFPSVRLIALSSDPKMLLRAIKAGATIALPKDTPSVKLAKVVSALAEPPTRKPTVRR
jgi:hypothetical protein